MKYLFFDIECSNCYGGDGKICEFGYALTDENFNLISKDDIPMSPGKGRYNRFDKTIYNRRPGYQWAYDFDYYLSCNEYPYFHNKIKAILEDKDTMVFGFSVSNDIRYLGTTIRRYKLNQISYKAFDVQVMMKYYSEKHQEFIGLEDAFVKLCGKYEMMKLQPHLSRDDAFMTMKVVEEMCKKLNIKINELIDLCPDCCIDVLPYLNNYFILKDNKKNTSKLNRNNIQCEEARELRNECLKSCLPLLENEKYIGKIITISRKIKESIEDTKKVIKKITQNGFVAYNQVDGSDFLVAIDETDIRRLKSIFKHPYNGKFITLTDFLNNNF